MRDTNIKIKEAYLPLFVEKIREQCLQGAKKYAQSDKKEYTDTICDVVGTKEFITGCIMKYIGRIINDDPRQEEDVVKIATYAFLLWIKLYAPELLDASKISVDSIDASKYFFNYYNFLLRGER